MNASQRAAQETAEEAIKQAGRKMREAMQKAHLDAQVAKPAAPEPAAAPSSTRPAMTPAELTLTLQFPAESTGIDFLASSATLEPRLTARYGPVNFIILKDPPAAEAGKRKKPRGAKAIVEFKESNWQGCWACWRDHVAKPARPLVEGTKVKWATPDGAIPPWIAWAETHRPSQSNIPPPPPPPTAPKISSAFASSFASSFPTPDERRQRDAQSAKADAARTAAEEYESATLFKMRQMERERLEAEIRRQEEEEET